jgi:hypothetical protein
MMFHIDTTKKIDESTTRPGTADRLIGLCGQAI